MALLLLLLVPLVLLLRWQHATAAAVDGDCDVAARRELASLSAAFAGFAKNPTHFARVLQSLSDKRVQQSLRSVPHPCK